MTAPDKGGNVTVSEKMAIKRQQETGQRREKRRNCRMTLVHRLQVCFKLFILKILEYLLKPCSLCLHNIKGRKQLELVNVNVSMLKIF